MKTVSQFGTWTEHLYWFLQYLNMTTTRLIWIHMTYLHIQTTRVISKLTDRICCFFRPDATSWWFNTCQGTFNGLKKEKENKSKKKLSWSAIVTFYMSKFKGKSEHTWSLVSHKAAWLVCSSATAMRRNTSVHACPLQRHSLSHSLSLSPLPQACLALILLL